MGTAKARIWSASVCSMRRIGLRRDGRFMWVTVRARSRGLEPRPLQRYYACMTSDPDCRLAQPHGLHHLALGARNVERLAAFYSMAFGLREVSRQRDSEGDLRSVWLALESAVLMIERTIQRRAAMQGVDAGLFLIAFRIDRSERADFESRLAAHACPVEATTEHTSYFRDPEGNRFAVSTYPLENPK